MNINRINSSPAFTSLIVNRENFMYRHEHFLDDFVKAIDPEVIGCNIIEELDDSGYDLVIDTSTFGNLKAQIFDKQKNEFVTFRDGCPLNMPIKKDNLNASIERILKFKHHLVNYKFKH